MFLHFHSSPPRATTTMIAIPTPVKKKFFDRSTIDAPSFLNLGGSLVMNEKMSIRDPQGETEESYQQACTQTPPPPHCRRRPPPLLKADAAYLDTETGALKMLLSQTVVPEAKMASDLVGDLFDLIEPARWNGKFDGKDFRYGPVIFKRSLDDTVRKGTRADYMDIIAGGSDGEQETFSINVWRTVHLVQNEEGVWTVPPGATWVENCRR